MTLGIIALSGAAALALFLLVSFTRHQRQLRREAVAYPAPGTLVDGSGTRIHVYAEGEGPDTLVFLAGHGTSNPVLDFKPLWQRLAGSFRIAVVERPGYGWSGGTGRPRDVDTLLAETRGALDGAGERGPYVLLAHSMAGLEALRWAQEYPGEVRALIGLDPCTPETVDLLPASGTGQFRFLHAVARTGLSRFMSEADEEKNFPLLAPGALPEADRGAYRALFYRSAFTREMVAELGFLRRNAGTVRGGGVPAGTPMLFFLSEGQEAAVSGWQDALAGYLAGVPAGRACILDAGHYLHYEEAETIAREAAGFLAGL